MREGLNLSTATYGEILRKRPVRPRSLHTLPEESHESKNNETMEIINNAKNITNASPNLCREELCGEKPVHANNREFMGSSRLYCIETTIYIAPLYKKPPGKLFQLLTCIERYTLLFYATDWSAWTSWIIQWPPKSLFISSSAGPYSATGGNWWPHADPANVAVDALTIISVSFVSSVAYRWYGSCELNNLNGTDDTGLEVLISIDDSGLLIPRTRTMTFMYA